MNQVTFAIGINAGQRWFEETIDTDLSYEECLDEALLLAEATQKINLGQDVAFVHMTHFEEGGSNDTSN